MRKLAARIQRLLADLDAYKVLAQIVDENAPIILSSIIDVQVAELPFEEIFATRYPLCASSAE